MLFGHILIQIVVPVCHVQMGSSGVRALIWTASGMGHWKRLIKISSGTDCYYCINNMTWFMDVYYYFVYTCYTFWYLIYHHVTCIMSTDTYILLCGYTCYIFPNVLSIAMSHIYFALLIFFTCTLFMYRDILHFRYYQFHIHWVDTLLLFKYNIVIWLLHVLHIYMFDFITTISYYCYH